MVIPSFLFGFLYCIYPSILGVPGVPISWWDRTWLGRARQVVVFEQPLGIEAGWEMLGTEMAGRNPFPVLIPPRNHGGCRRWNQIFGTIESDVEYSGDRSNDSWLVRDGKRNDISNFLNFQFGNYVLKLAQISEWKHGTTKHGNTMMRRQKWGNLLSFWAEKKAGRFQFQAGSDQGKWKCNQNTLGM